MNYKVRKTLFLGMSCSIFLLFFVSFFGVNYLHTAMVAVTRHVVDGSPVNFGKTHFIVGQTPQQRSRAGVHKKAVTVSDGRLSDTESLLLFSPDDNVREHLLDFILNEQERISVAVFVFTDKYIARALIDAFNRGVVVEVVTDVTGLRDRYNRIRDLCQATIPIFVYDAQNGASSLSSVMHHKFALFKRNKNNQSYVWTGSCNFTRSACESNQEFVIVLTDTTHVARFASQFELLKKRSYRYKK